MERKGPDSAEQHILELQRALQESKQRVALLEAHLGGGRESTVVNAASNTNTSGTAVLTKNIREEREMQAQRTENILVEALVKLARR